MVETLAIGTADPVSVSLKVTVIGELDPHGVEELVTALTVVW
jgi:hypothetical protein